MPVVVWANYHLYGSERCIDTSCSGMPTVLHAALPHLVPRPLPTRQGGRANADRLLCRPAAPGLLDSPFARLVRHSTRAATPPCRRFSRRPSGWKAWPMPAAPPRAKASGAGASARPPRRGASTNRPPAGRPPRKMMNSLLAAASVAKQEGPRALALAHHMLQPLPGPALAAVAAAAVPAAAALASAAVPAKAHCRPALCWTESCSTRWTTTTTSYCGRYSRRLSYFTTRTWRSYDRWGASQGLQPQLLYAAPARLRGFVHLYAWPAGLLLDITYQFCCSVFAFTHDSDGLISKLKN